ncbi:nucleolar protein 7 isoform X1 [Crotalus tigris]|uniref:nucleolar protein 7 isoform X1 n=1 Tax=Crotalus tigris TaxID=88082 RepID=UPI00192F6A35|nr:nucleolar protein 7 isoform X1 [Crotalus tigris]
MEAHAGGATAMEEREPAVVAAAAFSDGEESDEAPEEVTFERAREAAVEERRLAGERARREKALLKEKRRHREELFKEQKKRKLLPENILEELASTPKSTNQTSDEQDQNVEDEVENQEDSEKDSKEESLVARCPPNYMAVRLKDQELISQQQQEAKDFIQRQLYGASCNRTTANQYFSVESKKKTVKKAAIQFVNKSWGKMIFLYLSYSNNLKVLLLTSIF